MAKNIKVLFVSSEISPFAKTGGLADVASSLPLELSRMGVSVNLVMPKYGSIDENKFSLREVPDSNFQIQLGGKLEFGKLKYNVLNEKLRVYFLENDNYFKRNGLYVDPITNVDYQDNAERFIFFTKGILEVIRKVELKPDIIHCNDWQTALIPVYLKTVYSDIEFYNSIKTVYTIHNLAYQGIFNKEEYHKIGIPWSYFSIDGLEFFDKINFMKGGINFSDAITTVSEKYAQEISSSVEFGFGLEGVLANKKNILRGILNGVDYSVWNPAKDKLISQKYSSRSLEKKILNKKALLEKFNLPFDEKIPLIGIISRLATQKGIDLIEAASNELMQIPMQLVVLGTGEPKYQKFLENLSYQYPQKVGFFCGFSEELAHLIEAGSDMFLMPSRYEPCGLNQIYSLKYGTVPIVFAVGGLDDSIVQFNEKDFSGTGFKFYDYNSESLLDAVRKAIEIFRKQDVWKKLVSNGMKQDFSWKKSAKKYLNLYEELRSYKKNF